MSLRVAVVDARTVRHPLHLLLFPQRLLRGRHGQQVPLTYISHNR